MAKSSPDLRISVPPLPDHSANYLKAVPVPVQIVNGCNQPVLIESIALCFRSDFKVSPSDLTVEHKCDGLSIKQKHLGYDIVKVTPHLFYQQYTNVFDVVVTYRRQEKRGLGQRLKQPQRESSHLIIRPAPSYYGSLFISYKEPEDRELAEWFHALAGRAGFSPYIAPADMKPGSKIWRDKIPQEIKNSKATFVIWTSRTQLGTGVQREIKICRRNKIPDILLLEEGADPPSEHKGTDKEWEPFTRTNAPVTFSNVIRSYRDMQRG